MVVPVTYPARCWHTEVSGGSRWSRYAFTSHRGRAYRAELESGLVDSGPLSNLGDVDGNMWTTDTPGTVAIQDDDWS